MGWCRAINAIGAKLAQGKIGAWAAIIAVSVAGIRARVTHASAGWRLTDWLNEERPRDAACEAICAIRAERTHTIHGIRPSVIAFAIRHRHSAFPAGPCRMGGVPASVGAGVDAWRAG